MAADKGVRMVRIDTREPIDTGGGSKYLATDFLRAETAMMHPEVKALREEAARARAGTHSGPRRPKHASEQVEPSDNAGCITITLY